jgi:hypothetical protein
LRTTVNLDDEVYETVRALARRQRRSVGAILSELARCALKTSARLDRRGGFPIVAVERDAAPITMADVRRGEDEP